jgi:ribosomal-protein-alanine N-acetyltransferase
VEKTAMVKKYRLIALVMVCFASLSGWWLVHKQPSCITTTTYIYPYNAQTDRSFVLDLFKNNWYWLVSEYSPDFSAEYMLDNKASSKKLEDKGNLFLYIYRNPHPQGFLAYYIKNILFKKVGFVLFLVVDQQQRQRGIGSCLLQFALEDLKKRGCSHAQLITRVSNHAAQKTYLKHGFYIIWHDAEFVRFQKDL